ncbi:MAG TPA: cysteine hydrolase family protein [Acidobacteriota bacterium]|nr:cysteine hydrolase family protein [Acidobacteriota bacterium]
MHETSEHRALLVVDVQTGLFSPSSPKLKNATGLLGRITELIGRARQRGTPVIYTQFGGPSGTPLELDSPAAAIHPSVAPREDELVIHKDDSDAFLRTDLAERLKELGVETLIVCGLQSEFCVDSTCRTAYALGYQVVLVEDGHTTTDSDTLTGAQIADHHNRTLSRAYVTLSRAADVFE